MRLFLDASVLLAACNSRTGGSRFVLDVAAANGWTLFSSAYGIAEVEKNLPNLSHEAQLDWPELKSRLRLLSDTLVIDRPVIFAASKDRPVLLTAFAHTEVLLTLDRRDFLRAIGNRFYHLEIVTPEQFLRRERGRTIIVLP